MLDGARARAAREDRAGRTTFVEADVMALPFARRVVRRRDDGLLDAQRRRHRRHAARGAPRPQTGRALREPRRLASVPNPLVRRLFNVYFYGLVPLVGGARRRLEIGLPLSAEFADELSRRRRARRRASARAGFQRRALRAARRRRDRRARREPRTCSSRRTPTHDLYALVEDFFRNSFSTDNALITEAVRRMLAAGGKRLRPRFTLLGAAAMGATDVRAHLPLAAYMELIHVATLIHDDVVDNADDAPRRQRDRGRLRQSRQRAGRRLPLRVDLQERHRDVQRIRSRTSSARRSPTSPTAKCCSCARSATSSSRMSEYVEIAAKKTARLFASSAECGAWAAGGTALQDQRGARLRAQLRDRVPDAGRPARHDLDRGRARQAGRQRPAARRR